MQGVDEIAGIALQQHASLIRVLGARVESQPVLGPQQNNVHAPVILGQQTSWVQQLLEDLVIRSELDRGIQAEFPHPEGQGFQNRFCCEACRHSDLQTGLQGFHR